MKILIWTLALICLMGFSVPQAGVNYPVTGQAYDFVNDNNCINSGSVDCLGFTSNVINYKYPVEGVEFNPWFIVSYAYLLQSDCYEYNRQDACGFYQTNLNWLLNNYTSPQTGLDIYPVYDGRADALVQGLISVLFHREFIFTDNAAWLSKRDRAGAAFDWSWSGGGVLHYYSSSRSWYVAAGRNVQLYALNVHNKALINLHDLCVDYGAGDVWCARRNRGWDALNATGKRNVGVDDYHCPQCMPREWSFHRIATETSVSSCAYHKLNADTLIRLGDRMGRAGVSTSVVRHYAAIWNSSHKSNCF